MDDNTRQVLVALVGVIGGFASGVFVAKLGFDHARASEKDRWEREDRTRFLDQRRVAYADFSTVVERFRYAMTEHVTCHLALQHGAVWAAALAEAPDWAPVVLARENLEMIGRPDVRAAGKILLDAARELTEYGVPTPAIGSQVEVDQAAWIRDREAVECAQSEFAAAVRCELGAGD